MSQHFSRAVPTLILTLAALTSVWAGGLLAPAPAMLAALSALLLLIGVWSALAQLRQAESEARLSSSLTLAARAEAAASVARDTALATVRAQNDGQAALLEALRGPMQRLVDGSAALSDAELLEQVRRLARAINDHLAAPAVDIAPLERRLQAVQDRPPPPVAPAPAGPPDDQAALAAMLEAHGNDEAAGLLAAFAEEASDCITVLRGHEASRFWEARKAEAEGLTDTATSMGFHGLAGLARQIAELPDGAPGASFIETLDTALARILEAVPQTGE